MCPFPKALKGPLCQVPWTFHRPVLGKSICQWVTILAFISELRYFGLSAFKCTPCFLGNWSWEREAGLGGPRADWVGGLPKETGLFCRPGLRRKLCWLSPRPSCKNALARQQIINSPECPPSRLKTRIFFSCVGRTALHSYPGAPPQPHLQRAVIYVLAPLLGPRITQPRWTMINSLPSSMKKGGIPLEVLSFIWAETCQPREARGAVLLRFIALGFIWLSLPLHAVGARESLVGHWPEGRRRQRTAALNLTVCWDAPK